MLFTHVGLDMTCTVTVDVPLGRASHVACLDASVRWVKSSPWLAAACLFGGPLPLPQSFPLALKYLHILLLQLYSSSPGRQIQMWLLRFGD